jgi:hypothetical protein
MVETGNEKESAKEDIEQTLEEIRKLAPADETYNRDEVRAIAERLSQKYVKAVRAGT